MKQGKSWGDTTAVIINPFCEMHFININPWSRCSKHKHNFKTNLFFVTLGELIIKTYKDGEVVDETLLQEGEWTKVPPGEFHEFQTRSQHCQAIELYYPEGIKDDIIRLDQGGKIPDGYALLPKHTRIIIGGEEVVDE